MEFKDILSGLKIKADIEKVEKNGTTTKIYLKLHPSAKVCRIENCSTEIALGSKSYGKPIIRIIPEQGLVCIELLNTQIHTVNFSEFDEWFQTGIIKEYGELPVVLGRKHDGGELIIDLAQMPHLLVAGGSGSGKSALLHSIIASIIKTNHGTRLILIDGKQVEFQPYQNIKQLLYPVISNAEDALDVLEDLISEMDNRFIILEKAGANNIKEYNKYGNPLPYIVSITDEFSDIQRIFKKEFQSAMCILSQKGRAAGIHLIIATQRPDCGVINGVVKANFTSRIALRTATSVDSRVILDKNSAEVLRGNGDAIINSGNFDFVRFQSAYIGQEERAKLCEANRRPGPKWWKEMWKESEI